MEDFASPQAQGPSREQQEQAKGQVMEASSHLPFSLESFRADMAPYRAMAKYAQEQMEQAMLNARPAFCKCCGAPPEKDNMDCSWCKAPYFG